MKKFLFLTFFIIVNVLAQDNCGDNVVSNGDFEATMRNVCRAEPGGIYGSIWQIPLIWHNQTPVDGWFGTARLELPSDIIFPTPDYYNFCTNTNQIQCMGQVGSAGYWAHFNGNESGEYLQTRLNRSLKAGTEYCVSVLTSTFRGNRPVRDTDKLGFWFHNRVFSDGSGFAEWIDDNGGLAFMGPGSLVNGTPQIVNPPGQMIVDECRRLQYSFCADGGERFLMIGNFTPGTSDSGEAEYVSIDEVVVRESCPISFDLVIDDGGSSATCLGDCITLNARTINIQGGCRGADNLTYQWQENGIDIPGATDLSLEICPTEATTYTLIGTYTTGCSAITVPMDYQFDCCNTNAGSNGDLQLCDPSNDPIDLFTFLSGNPEVGGTWTGPSTLTNNDQGTYIPGTNIPGTYSYSVTGDSCSDTANVEVTEGMNPELNFLNIACRSHLGFYSIFFTPNPSTSTITTTAGTIGDFGISNIPLDTDITITLNDNGCEETFEIEAPDCNCPNIMPPTNPNNPTICEGDPTPNLIVNVPGGINVSWYASPAEGAELFTGNPFTPTDTGFGNYTYYAEAVETDTNCRSERIAVNLTVTQIPAVELPSVSICKTVNENGVFELDTFLDPTIYTFNWSRNGTAIAGESGPALLASETGEYAVTYTLSNSTNCSGSATAMIELISGPENLSLEIIRNNSALSPIIAATIIGDGTYEYSLDGEVAQQNNVFTNVTAGVHTVTAYNLEGCGELSEEIFVVDFPRYFTPNGDNINDYWNVITASELPEMDLFIFDRYGKFIKKINPGELGWDGTLNNEPLPATDYWFIVKFKDGSEDYSSHFTLRR